MGNQFTRREFLGAAGGGTLAGGTALMNDVAHAVGPGQPPRRAGSLPATLSSSLSVSPSQS